MVVTRRGGGADVPGKKKSTKSTMGDISLTPPFAPVTTTPGMVTPGAGGSTPAPTTQEHRRAQAMESMGQMDVIIHDYEEHLRTGTEIPERRLYEDMILTAKAARRSHDYFLHASLDVSETVTRNTAEMRDKTSKLAELLGMTASDLLNLPVAELQNQMAAAVQEIITARLPEAVTQIPENRRLSLTSTLGSRGNGGVVPIPAGRTHPFPRKIRTDWAAKLKPGMAYNAARTYLEDVRDYVNLPQHAEYRDDLQFLRMIASSSMEQEALAQFREAADPVGEPIVTDYASFTAWVESAFMNTVPAFVRQMELESCRQKAGDQAWMIIIPGLRVWQLAVTLDPLRTTRRLCSCAIPSYPECRANGCFQTWPSVYTRHCRKCTERLRQSTPYP